MPVEIKMPDLSTTGDEVTFVRWLVDVGATVKLNQPLLEIETDKATMEVESIAAGVLQSVLVDAGDIVAVGQLIALIAPVGENITSQPTPTPSAVTVAPPTPVIAAPALPATPSPVPTLIPVQPARMSFFARNKANRLAPTLRNSIALTGIQRDVARRLQEAQSIPHFYLDTSANAEPMVARRTASARKIVWDAFFVHAAARALQTFDRMQYHFEGESLTRNPNAVGVALDVDDALFVMPIENPLALSLEALSEQIADRVQRIKAGDPAAGRLTPTWLTISNLGAQNIETFHAIINPPGAAILSIGKIASEVVATSASGIAIQQRVRLSLSVDHRVVNGKYAARFLTQLVNELETL